MIYYWQETVHRHLVREVARVLSKGQAESLQAHRLIDAHDPFHTETSHSGGRVDFGTGQEELHLEKGDIIQVREGFHARIRTTDEVLIFFASYLVSRGDR